MDASAFRELVDPLYGRIRLDDFLAALVSQPEMQRLRDVRLSNINSLLLAGGANISRFEHSVGTALLAQRAARSLQLSEADQKRLVCAALLHDVAITPFGHLMEEAFHLAGVPFDHESRLQQIFLGETEVGNTERQIYRGRSAGFRTVLERAPFRALGIRPSEVFELTRGSGPLGHLINGSLDLDNTDNVARMAHHIGIPFRKALPTDIADNFGLSGDELYFNADRVDCLHEWLDLRRRLYSVFMTNPIDFSAKAMLIEAMRLAIQGTDQHEAILDETSWSLTDRELMNGLNEYVPAKALLDRFETADYYDVVGLYWVEFGSNCEATLPVSSAPGVRIRIAEFLGFDARDVLVYWIRDKRARSIADIRLRRTECPTDEIDRVIVPSSKMLLFGVVIAKKNCVNRKLEEACKRIVSEIFAQGDVSSCDTHSELSSAFVWRHVPENGQRTLF